MVVAAFVHFYVPFRNAGSETMLHCALRRLVDDGHEVVVFATIIPDAPESYLIDGVTVVRTNSLLARQQLRQLSPDVIVTHHHNTPAAVATAKKIGAKSVFLMHNDFEENRRYLGCNPDLVVFNTEWIREASGYTGPSVVIHPPVVAGDHRTTPGDKVTLVNLNKDKGAELFYRAAEAMPDISFLGVVGGHGEQIVRSLPNVEIQGHTSDMVNDVWSRTRILLMPSAYESYGMAGVEAMASGIPVIANGTPGLHESLSYAGIFGPRADEHLLHSEIRRLQNHHEWSEASELAVKRSNELDPTVELNEWVSRIEHL